MIINYFFISDFVFWRSDCWTRWHPQSRLRLEALNAGKTSATNSWPFVAAAVLLESGVASLPTSPSAMYGLSPRSWRYLRLIVACVEDFILFLLVVVWRHASKHAGEYSTIANVNRCTGLMHYRYWGYL